MDPNEAKELANEKVTITTAFSIIGAEVNHYATSTKHYCPFGHIYHADGGSSKALRVYPETNSAWCFAGCGYFNPVKLIAMDKDISEEASAEFLLDFIGYVPPDYESTWDAMMSESPKVDTSALAEALKLACSRVSPDWEQRQFEPSVAQRLSQCLRLLPRVHTEEEAVKWLAVTKQAMQVELGRSP